VADCQGYQHFMWCPDAPAHDRGVVVSFTSSLALSRASDDATVLHGSELRNTKSDNRMSSHRTSLSDRRRIERQLATAGTRGSARCYMLSGDASRWHS
jgi:hypothetical protein